MSRKKLERFRQNAENRNVVEPGKEIYENIKGNWKEFLGNQNEIVLEVGCGRGEYTTGLATLFPHRNFIGIDIKGSRIWKGSTVAIKENLQNVAFLRVMIQNLDEFFAEGEADEIWITFPDPRPKEGDERLRLTSPRFMEMYQRILKKGGKLNLKTDNEGLFDYTLELAKQMPVKNLQYTKDLYQSDLCQECFGVQTTYEKKFLAEGVPIKYLAFNF